MDPTTLNAGLDAFRARNRKPGKPCGVARLDLNRSQRVLLERALADPTIQAGAIADMLTEEWGMEITKKIVNRHRAGDCNCKEAGE